MKINAHMKTNQDLLTVRDEVFRKIGRNLLNFQKIEFILKYLITVGHSAGYVSELKQNMDERREAVYKKTMGNLMGEFAENILQSPNESSSISTEKLKEPYLSFAFSVEAKSDFYESKKQDLKSLVDDRNDLIHHLLPRFNPDSLESCLEVERYLDEQREKMIPEYEFLKSLTKNLEIFIKVYADHLNSEEGQRQFNLCFLQQSSLVLSLLDVAAQKSRSDGWMCLSSASQEIRKILPGELEQLSSKWSYKN